jgi:hypothetical protein
LILLSGLLLGIITGLLIAWKQKQRYEFPLLRVPWLVVIAYIPQLLAFSLPATRTHFSPGLASIFLLGSQVLLLIFCWLNRHFSGIWLLAVGLTLNFLVIALNGGFMPISPQTASHLVSAEVLQRVPVGTRFGFGKDILLQPMDTRLAWLSDRLLLPRIFPHQVAFSFGDIAIALGAFWTAAFQGKPLSKFIAKK